MSISEDNVALNEIMKNAKPRRATVMKEDCCDPSTGCDDEPRQFGKLSQWTTGDDKRFLPAGYTKNVLPPGVYEIHHDGNIGLYFEKIPVRTEGLIRFPQTNSERVLKEIDTFWSREKVFKKYALTYKRGIILWGPPGGGKTCTVNLIMRDVVVDRSGIVIKFTNPGLFIEGMRILREIQPDTPIVVLMEDIDSIIEHYEESPVLNILDGVESVQKVVFLACPSPETRILKADLTWVRADSLSKDDELIAFDEEGPERKYRTTKVNSCPIVHRPCFRVTTDCGSITVSEKHPFLVKSNKNRNIWAAVEQLEKDSLIAYIGKPWDIDKTHDGGYLAGQYDGEGTLNIEYRENSGSHGFRATWVQANGEIVNIVERMLNERNFDVSKHSRVPVEVGKYGLYKPKTSISVRGGRWESLRLLGMIRPIRLLSHPKLKDAWEGVRLATKYAKVISVEPIGMGPVVALDTTTKTFIGEGMLQHNTTNYPECLGPRIINRPSRFDKRFHIGYPNPESRMLYFKYLCGDKKSAKIDLARWVKDTDKFSIAHLKELFVAVIIIGDEYDEALENLKLMKEDISSDKDSDKNFNIFGKPQND